MTPEEIAAAEAEARRLEQDNAPPPSPTAEEAAAEAERVRLAQEAREEERRRKTQPTDEEAELLREVMKYKQKAKDAEARAKLYEGIDPAKARAALEAQAEAERKELEKRGEYDRILEQVRTQADERVAAAEARANEVEARLADMARAGEEKDVENTFATSDYIRDNLVIGPKKVRTLFGDHFEMVDGTFTGFDKPKGAKDRTPLVDGNGNALDFEHAIEKIVKADGDYERLVKSKVRPGASSAPQGLPESAPKLETGTDMIRAGLNRLSKASKLTK